MKKWITCLIAFYNKCGVGMYNVIPMPVRQLPIKRFTSVLKAWLLKNPFYRMEEFWDANFNGLLDYLCPLNFYGGKEDIRPGLIKSYSQQYDHQRAKKRMEAEECNRISNPSLKQRQTTSREEGLSKPLDSNNVGFKMLQKLGFQPGSGLGKSGTGRVEPIPVEVKSDRQGLGRKALIEEIAKLQAKYRAEAREKRMNIEDYRLRKAEQAAEKRAFLDLCKSQRVCWELDTKECIEEPAEKWFWPESKLPLADDEFDHGEDEENSSSVHNEETDKDKECEEPEEEEEYVDEFSVHEKLEMLTLYLRRTYYYCVWCGHSFDDERDMQQECPGPTREDH